jgi:two-component system CheB/CheR fusion protein
MAERVGGGRPRLSEHNVRKVVHELEVHQVELELQNEALVSARLETEASLELYTELFDFAPSGYAALAPDGTVRKVNLAAARLLGIEERSRAVGRPFESFVAREDQPVLAELILRAHEEGGDADRREVKLRTPAGPVHVQLTATGVQRPTWAVLVAIMDITERKRQEELAQKEVALREASRLKDEFLAALSHELRNPLGPILTGLHLLHEEPLGARARKVVGILDRQVSYLTRLIEDLLDVTRISRGKFDVRMERVELGGLVVDAMEDHRPGFEQRGILLESRLEPEPLWVDADPARLTQAISNLLGNAEKFTPRGGRVTVTLECCPLGATLRVSDTGRGIAPEMLPHVFEPFTLAPQSVDRINGGLGLGLTMAKGFVERMGGTIGVTSAGVGHGAQFVVSLPPQPAPVATSTPRETARSPGRRVLVIEDNPDAIETLSAALELFGHEVRSALDGPSGLELARTFHPEVVLCDIGLPTMDGHAVARAFRADGDLKGVRLIALTGYAMPEDVERATDAGFDAHVSKPPALDDLNRLLAQAAAHHNGAAPRARLKRTSR